MIATTTSDSTEPAIYTKAQIHALVAAVANSHPTDEPTVLAFRVETIRQLLALPTSD